VAVMGAGNLGLALADYSVARASRSWRSSTSRTPRSATSLAGASRSSTSRN
jgi:hypothetical protein